MEGNSLCVWAVGEVNIPALRAHPDARAARIAVNYIPALRASARGENCFEA